MAENEEDSPPSLKRKLFLKHSAVKVHRNCVGDITCEEQLSKWKRQPSNGWEPHRRQ